MCYYAVLQVGPIVVLILSISVYGFAKPYKERIANVLELVYSAVLFPDPASPHVCCLNTRLSADLLCGGVCARKVQQQT